MGHPVDVKGGAKTTLPFKGPIRFCHSAGKTKSVKLDS